MTQVPSYQFFWDWLEYYLFARDAILLLDGLDELPDAKFKQTVRKKVSDLFTGGSCCAYGFSRRFHRESRLPMLTCGEVWNSPLSQVSLPKPRSTTRLPFCSLTSGCGL